MLLIKFSTLDIFHVLFVNVAFQSFISVCMCASHFIVLGNSTKERKPKPNKNWDFFE